MFAKVLFSLLATALMLGASGCGRNATVDKQEAQRSEIEPELQGAWMSTCQSSQIQRVTFDSDNLTFEKTEFFDPECQEKVRTITHTGKQTLANNYKEGVNNSVIFTASSDVSVTLHTDFEVDQQNSALSRIQNETEREIGEGLPPATKKSITRANLKIRAGKAVSQWKRDEPKTLGRLALEKLAEAGLAAAPVAEQASRISVRYEVDNGHLQLAGPSGFTRVYQK